MTTMQDALTNALLADAAYVGGLAKEETGANLSADLSPRMTPTLAAQIAKNFTVVSQFGSGVSSFDVTVWQTNNMDGTRNPNGKIYISMRGSQQLVDFLVDADLAVSGNARFQITEMVNWWLRISTPTDKRAPQVASKGSSYVGAPTVAGDGVVLSANLAGGVEVNGHSLGGYLATAFTRLFGQQANVVHTSTFNSAGFAAGSEAVFIQLGELLGPALGLSRYPNGAEQTNYFARNGLNFTTNSFYFNQQGRRVEIFNESDITQLGNHYMYKLTDALVLGNALSQLDPNLTSQNLNAILAAGANESAASIEGGFDGLQRMLLGPAVGRMAVGDSDASSATRVAYHATLSALVNSKTFQSLQGQLVVTPINDASRLARDAKSDFARLVELQQLIPFDMHDRAGGEALVSVLQKAYADAYVRWNNDQANYATGNEGANFTDRWLRDRAAMLGIIVERNKNDIGTFLRGRENVDYTDVATGITVSVRAGVSSSGAVIGQVRFGGETVDSLTGQEGADQLYGDGGDDTLNGAGGNDYLEGGRGIDTYLFTGPFGNDTIVDTDGKVKIDGNEVKGGKKVIENVWESEDKAYVFTQLGGNLIIGRRTAPGASAVSGTITVQNWANNQLGITLDGAAAPLPPTGRTFIGDQRAPQVPGNNGDEPYDWSKISWQADGTLLGGVAETDFSDVIHVTGSEAAKIQGLGGNDALEGGSGADQIDGGDGDDLIGGGAGSDHILGGNGNDTILSAISLTVSQRYQPSDHFPIPAGATIRSVGPGWAVYNLGPNLYIVGGGTGAPDSDGDVVDAGAGNDIVFAGPGDDQIQGGTGNDLVEGHGGDDIIEGGAGNDAILGDGFTGASFDYRFVDPELHGSDFIDGGDGDDIIIGGGAADFLYGGKGNDTILGDTNGDAVGQPGWLEGRFHGDDYIDGEDGDDILAGDGGDDTIYGGSGNDLIAGDRAQSQVAGEFHGNDYLDGEDGNDVIIGGGKDDTLFGGAGNDRLEGDGVEISGQFHGNDYLDGEDGEDILIGGGKDDILYGGAGSDTLYGDNLPGGPNAGFFGDDYLDGGDGDDFLFGGGGNDILIGGAGKNYLDGGDGDDIYEASLGDTIHDSGGKNTIIIDGGAPITVEVKGKDLYFGFEATAPAQSFAKGLSLMAASFGSSSLTIDGAFEGGSFTMNDVPLDNAFFSGYDITLTTTEANQHLTGWGGNDTLTAEHDDATLDGAGGNDIITGSWGNDILIGGSGSNSLHGGGGDDILTSSGSIDVLDGGGGDDSFRIDAQAGQVTIATGTSEWEFGHDKVVLAGSSATTRLTAVRSGSDAVITTTKGGNAGSGGSPEVAGTTLRLSNYFTADGGIAESVSAIDFEDGSLVALSELLASTIQGSAGNDFLKGTPFADRIYGGDGDDVIHGGAGNDLLVGGAGNDSLFGEAGQDTLEGGEGNDMLRGGSGSDLLKGEAGDDVYVFGNEEQPLLQRDVEAGQEVDLIQDDQGNNVISLGNNVNLAGIAFVRQTGSVSSLYFNRQKIEIHGPEGAFAVLVNGQTLSLDSFLPSVPSVPGDPALTPAQRAFLAEREQTARASISDAVLRGLFGRDTDSTSSLWANVESNEEQVTASLPHSGYVATEYYGVVSFMDSKGNPVASNTVAGIYDGTLPEVDGGAALETILRNQGRQIDVLETRPGTIYRGPTDLGPGGFHYGQVISWDWRGIDQGLTDVYGTYTVSQYVDHQAEHAANVKLGDGANALKVGAGVVHAGAGDDQVRNRGNWLNEAQNATERAALLSGVTVSFTDGGDGDDYIMGNELNDVLYGGRGRDILDGRSGSDRYLVLDYGQSSADEDAITDLGTTNRGETGDLTIGPDEDTVEFGPGIALADIFFLREQRGWAPYSQGQLVVMRQGRRLAAIDLAPADAPAGAGVEFLQFASGETITMAAALAMSHDTAPLTAEIAADARAAKYGDFRYELGGLFWGGTGQTSVSTTLADGSTLPDWLTFDPVTRSFAGVPGQDAVGTYRITMTAYDEAGAQVVASFSIVVSNNDAPVTIGSPGTLIAPPQQQFLEQLSADLFRDVNAGDTLTWQLRMADGSALPAWLHFDPVTRTLSGTPTYADSGSIDLALSATDQEGASASQVLTVNVGEVSGDNIVGSAWADNLIGTAGNDTIDGLGKADVMTGRAGNDVYGVDNKKDVIRELFNQGYDLVEAQIGYTLPDNVEAIRLMGTRNIAAKGNALDNALYGNAGNNRLDGGAGADFMAGGAGNDVYLVDTLGDRVEEAPGEGIDTVIASINFTLGENVERLNLSGVGLTGSGNDLNNLMTASAEGSTLLGLAGNDRLRGGAESDTLFGGIGNDRLEGGAGADHLFGDEGNDDLDGGEGADELVGGVGNDTYVVDNSGDTVRELTDEGKDTVEASIDYTLGANLENLTPTGTALLLGTGNELDNVLTASEAGSVLHGLGGDDKLVGGLAHDVLFGDDGDDRLDGGAAGDTMFGGTGNDVYIVDNAADEVVELANEGTDTVRSSITYTLGANVENLTLTGVEALAGTGNALANVLTGRSGPSTLSGMGGNDTLKGGADADVLIGGAGNDRLEGGLQGDTYKFGRGDGQDTIVENDATPDVVDTLRFDAGIDATQLWWRKAGNNLEVSVIGSTDKVTVSNWYLGSERHVEVFELANGQRLLDTQVQSLVQAMASFAAPPAGQTSLPANYQSSLEPVIAANWH
jgi:Ca2+-binding RTX toxin-like protein